MENDRKQKLMDLGPDVLSDALLELAVLSEDADQLIGYLISTPEENIQRFKKKLTSLKRSKRFIDWSGSFGFANELKTMLQDLRGGITDPMTGVELVAAFFETDDSIFDRCDDSGGNVGDVFLISAQELFVDYASNCSDNEKIAEILLKLTTKNDYGVRDTLIESASEYLPESVIRSMINRLQKLADKEKDKYGKRHYLMLIESLARQIRDAELFKKTCIASWDELPSAVIIDIARVYLESGDVDTAHTWIKKIPEGEYYKAGERDQLLMEIYKVQGNIKKFTDLIYKKFRSHRSRVTLQELLDVIGHDKANEVISGEIDLIHASSELHEPDAEFLIEAGKVDDAEEYLIKRANQFNGKYYVHLIPLVEAMESENKNLAASLIYRSLLISILERGYTKAYPHGVRYLKKLDKLAVTVTDWQGYDTHEIFKKSLNESHGRKRSFWSKYDTK